MLRMRSVRGPSSYGAGGFTITAGEVQAIEVSSGRMALASMVSSSYFFANVVNTSGNIATVILRDSRSGGLEPTSGDLSNLHVALVYEGI
jgi:hypothetical protein